MSGWTPVHGHALSGILHLWWWSTYPEYSLGKVLHVGDLSWMTTDRGIFSPLQCIFRQMPTEMCSDMDCQAGIAQGAAQESPGLRLTRCTRKDIPGSWPNHCVSCLLGSGYGFFSAPKPTVFEKGTLSSLFIFKSVLTA